MATNGKEITGEDSEEIIFIGSETIIDRKIFKNQMVLQNFRTNSRIRRTVRKGVFPFANTVASFTLSKLYSTGTIVWRALLELNSFNHLVPISKIKA